MNKLRNNCFFTSFNKAYAPQAILLAESLRRHYGSEIKIYAVLVDILLDGELSYLDIFDGVMLPEDLDIPNFKAWIFGLDIVEAATAVKPFALCKLLEEFSQVTYLDPDTLVYSRFNEIFEPNDGYDAFLTPHQTMPEEQSWAVQAMEIESLRFGVYNLGFLSVRSTANGSSIAKWWRDRCYEYCISEPAKGLFTDQKLFDLAPALFSGVKVLRNSGYNVATWNLRERNVQMLDSQLLANGVPLRFCHFTKATHIGGYALQRMLKAPGIFEELFYSYVARLQERSIMLKGLSKKWEYGCYEDGSEILGVTRKQFRNLNNRFQYENPFQDRQFIESLLI